MKQPYSCSGRRPWCDQLSLGIVIGVILIVGLFPRGNPFRNGAQWADHGKGLVFDDPGIAFTAPSLGEEGFSDPESSGFTIGIVIRPETSGQESFSFVNSIHNGNYHTLLLLGQWKNSLILMNGDDYSHSRRLPRVTAQLDPSFNGPRLVMCTSGSWGTRIFINGRLAAEREGWRADIPTNLPPNRVILGSGPTGKNAWKGTVSGYALWSRVLTQDEVSKCHSDWSTSGRLAAATDPDLAMLIPFEEGRGEIAHDISGNGRDLRFPSNARTVEGGQFEQALKLHSSRPRPGLDEFINLFGFVPFGFFLMRLRPTTKLSTNLACSIGVTGCGLALSASIELLQSWFPERISSVQDLFLNTLGTSMGALIAIAVNRIQIR